ncbi:MAG: ATP-grasp domain-containing protein [Myxococcota bacterium]
MIRAALVHSQNPSRPLVEAQAVFDTFAARGLPTTPFPLKRLTRRQLPLAPDVLVAGDTQSVPMALRQLGIEGPFLPTYPSALRPWMGRRIRLSTVANVRRSSLTQPQFVKPAARTKRFTGFVLREPSDEMYFAGASGQTEVWLADVVDFTVEHRVYVIDGRVRGVCGYAGRGPTPPSAFLENLVAALVAAGEPTAGIAVDVGMVEDRWVVVECNEGFGLGLYPGFDAATYTDLLLARWRSLTATLRG